MKNQTRINQLLTVLLLLCVLFVCMAGTAMAEEDCAHVFADGQCTACGVTGGYCGAEGDGTNLVWTLNDGTFAITGTGAMADYGNYTDRPWNAYRNSITALTIQEGVTTIGRYAFYQTAGLKNVTIPASVTKLGRCAFVRSGLEAVTFADESQLTTIDYCAFQSCKALTEITLPAGVGSFQPHSVFSGCTALTDIHVAEGNTTYKSVDGVLYTADGTSLMLYPAGKTATSFTTPAGVTTIGPEAFHKNGNIKSVTLSEGVTTISDRAFLFCGALAEVTIPASVTSIGTDAFYGCDALTAVNAPCNWDGTLYTFADTVTVNVAEHTLDENSYTDNGDGTHDVVCTTCGYVNVDNEPHTYDDEDGICVCSAVKTYTVTFNPYGDSGAKIMEINGEAVEISNGETFTVPHGQDLTVKFENTLSTQETGVYCDGYVFIDPNLFMCNYNEATNTLTIPGSIVTGDLDIYASAYVRVQFNLHGGALTDDGRELLVEVFGFTWDAETSTLKTQYSFSFALRPEYFQLAGHTLAGAKVEGSDEVETGALEIRSDMTVDILWECDYTAILTPVEAKDATCMEAGNIAHYTCTCGKLYEDEAGTKELTAEDVKTDIDPTNHVGVDTATGKCACDYQFGFYVERDIEIDGIYHETYWFDNLSDALSYAHGSTDYGQYTTQRATVRLHRDLTIEEGAIFSFQKQVVLDTNSFSVTNSGTLALEGYTYSTIPAAITGGTVTIGDKTYLWSSENEKWICAEGSHVTELEENKATCAKAAICDLCGASYGAVDKTNHDTENAEYDNGFCTVCDAYEPAELLSGVYQISNAGNLYWFADKVTNENAAYGSADAILTCDIRVNKGTMTEASTDARVWTPIGKMGWIDNKRVEYPYTGTFEGNGKTVSGLYFNDTSANFSVGLFSLVGEGGTVRNVGIADSYLCGSQSIGAVAGSNYGTVTGCYNTGTVSGTSSVGGVVGGNSGTVTDCHNTGTVSGSGNCVGGVAGSNNGTVTDCHNTGTVSGSGNYVGGVVGDSDGIVTDCHNTGAVSSSGNRVGGVAGYNGGTATGCYNSGTVSGTTFVGGVVGMGYASNCYNTGAVSGTTNVGGVVGNLIGYAILEGCYNTGTVSGTDYVGGVAGYNNATVTNCYFDSTVCTGDAIGSNYGTATDVEGKSTEQFASGEVAYLLSQGENGSIWGQTIGTDPAPVFSDAKVYYGYTSCGDTAAVYTNNANVFPKKPEHTQNPTYTDNHDGTHSAVYPCCGTKGQPENHTLTYTTNGSTITESCSANCGYSETATISAEDTTYNGAEQKTATVTYSDGWKSDELNVSYENNVNAGTATASITVGEVTASVDFTIAKAEPKAENFVFQSPDDLTYNGETKSASVSVQDGIVGMGDIIAVMYYNGDSIIAVEKQPISAGNYFVQINVDEGENYTARSFFGGEDWVFTIAPMQIYIDPDFGATLADVVYNESGVYTLTVTGVAFKRFGVGNTVPLTLGTDYTATATQTDVSYGELIKAVTATVDVTLKNGNYQLVDTNVCTATANIVEHEHDWKYTANGATITATCANTDGHCPDAEQSITLAAPGAVYSGNPVAAEVTRDGEDLTYTLRYTGTDYDSPDAPVNAGDYTVTMTVGDKSVSASFTISPKDISVVQSVQFSLAQTSFVYSGEAPKLAVNAVDSSVGNYTMQENTDYTVGTVQVNAGSYKLTVTGMGNYTGSVELAYEINRAPIGAAVITAESQVYTGEALEPAFTVELNGKALKHNVDFTFSWTNNVNVGEGKIVINGIGNYEGQAEGTFAITSAPADLTAETYLGETMTGDFTYGDVITIKGAVTVDQQNTFSLRRAPAANEVVLYLEGGNEVIAGPVAADPATGEFTLTYDTSNKDIDIGQRNLTLAYVSDGNKQDTTGSLTVTLNPKELTIISAGAADRVYEKGNKLVNVTGVDLDGIVVIGDDVKADLTGVQGTLPSDNAGTYTTMALPRLTLTGNDSAYYTIAADDAVTTSVEITPKEITSPTIVLDASSFVYDGTEKKPAVTSVKDGDDLIDATEYTVSYANNIEMGTATVTLTDAAGGNYTVSGSTTFQITQSGTAMTAAADKTSYTYGETITVTGTVKATGTAPATTLTLRSAPAAQQVALFAADGTQLTDPVNVVEGVYTLTYNTTDKGILPAEAITLTVKFVGDDNMVDQSAAVTVALTAKSIGPVLAGSASKAYDGTATVTDAGNLTISLNGVITGDNVSAAAAGYAYADETVGQSKTVTANGITLSGADSIFYTLAQTEASAQIGEIKKAMLIGLTEPADTTLDVYCADADAVIGKLPDTVVYHLADGKTVDLKVEWSCTAYDSTPGATNTFAWAINDSEKLACYEIAQNVADDGTIIVTNSAFLPVTVTGTDTAITYNGTAYDVTQMFAIDSNAGAAVFEIIGGGTGEGTLNGSVLTITKAGTITIKVTTAPNAAYAAGEATAVLTISKGTPAVTLPTDLTAWYAQKLSDIVLPTVDGGAWSWTNMNSTVGNSGVQTHQAIFTPADTNLWNITTHPVNITVVQAGTSFGDMKVYNGNAETTTFTYGETITVKAEATAVQPAVFSLRSLIAPAKHQMALYIRTADGSEVQISEAVNEQNGVYTMTYNTAGKALSIGENALIAKFVGDENMADYQETVLVTLNPKELTIASLTAQDRVYEPGNQEVAVTDIEVSGKVDANDDVSVLIDGMTATISSENVGTYDEALIPQDVSLTGSHAGYYFARGNVAVSIPKGVEITQATPSTASGAPAQPVFEPIYQDGQTLGDIPVSLPAGTFNVPGTIEWEAPGDTPVTEGTPFTWVFTPDDPNWKPVTGTVVIYPDGEPPVITAPAGDQEVTVYEGEQGTMAITAADASSYQWYINRYDGLGYVPISGATSASYTTSVVNLGNDGFTYYCVASNAYGETESPVFLLQVLEKIEVPETGDESNIALWAVLTLLSVVGLATIVATGRIRKNN